MKVVLWMGMSVNGIIAGEDNNEDFISHDTWLAWLEELRKHGCLIFGRKTYEVVKTWPKSYSNDIKGIRAVVVSTNPNFKVNPGFELADSPQSALKTLENQGFKKVVLTGGGSLDSAFAKLGLINEVIFNIEPVMIGKGIPVFRKEDFELKLELIEMKPSKGKTIQLHYRVKTK